MSDSNFWRNKNILLTGGAGFLGSHVLEQLLLRGAAKENILIPRSREHDLGEKEVTKQLVQGQDIIIHCAAAVGGIGFNKENPASIFYDNAAMALYLIGEGYRAGVKKFVGIGSVVEYPENAPIPFREEHLWAGQPNEVNAPYALAKRFMHAQSLFYHRQFGFEAVHLLPVKIYGPAMSFDRNNSQVVAALIQKVDHAKKSGRGFIEVWGSGKATREFIYVDDAAEAAVLAGEKYTGPEPLNIGTGIEVSIHELVETICRLMGWQGEIRWDRSRPQGELRSVSDVTRAEEILGWTAKITLEEGLAKTIEWYQRQHGV